MDSEYARQRLRRFVSNAVPVLDMFPRRAQGKDVRVDYEQFNFNGSRFQVSGELSNPEALPFTPSFSADNMVPPYDLLSSLATQPGQTTLLTSPGVIEVYVDTTP
jgi:hypothetical protein